MADGCEPVRVLVEAEPAVEGVDLADVCGPVLALEEEFGEVLGAVGKKLSEVSMIGEKRILVCLFAFHVSLHDSFSSFSSSEL